MDTTFAATAARVREVKRGVAPTDVYADELKKPLGSFLRQQEADWWYEQDMKALACEALAVDAKRCLQDAAPKLLHACKMARMFGSQGDTDEGISVSYLLGSAIDEAEGRL